MADPEIVELLLSPAQQELLAPIVRHSVKDKQNVIWRLQSVKVHKSKSAALLQLIKA